MRRALWSRRSVYIVFMCALITFAPSVCAWHRRCAVRCCSLLTKAAVGCGRLLSKAWNASGFLVRSSADVGGQSSTRTLPQKRVTITGNERDAVEAWNRMRLAAHGPKAIDGSEYVWQLGAMRSTIVPPGLAVLDALRMEEYRRWCLGGGKGTMALSTGCC